MPCALRKVPFQLKWIFQVLVNGRIIKFVSQSRTTESCTSKILIEGIRKSLFILMIGSLFSISRISKVLRSFRISISGVLSRKISPSFIFPTSGGLFLSSDMALIKMFMSCFCCVFPVMNTNDSPSLSNRTCFHLDFMHRYFSSTAKVK